MSHNYCGYQFGQWAGQLGDGRAHTLGWVKNANSQLIQLQLKGSGKTPFSRGADGNAVLRSSIRQFLASQFMNHLGIPTTRAGSLVLTDDLAIRDPLYSGKVIKQRCAVVLRASKSFIRFGSLQFEAHNKQLHFPLFRYIINELYPQFKKLCYQQQVYEFCLQISRRTGKMIGLWMVYGFCHGVMNTDNMSIIGQTIDYGPYGFLQRYNQDHICNSSDQSGRYSFKNQPHIGLYNLKHLFNTFNMEMDVGKLEKVYWQTYQQNYLQGMCFRLGFNWKQSKCQQKKHLKRLIKQLTITMNKTGILYNQFFITLLNHFKHKNDINQLLHQLAHISADLPWIKNRNKPKLDPQQLRIYKQLIQNNPALAKQLGISMQQIGMIQKQIQDSKKQISINHQLNWKQWVNQYLEVPKKNLQLLQNNPKFVLYNYVAQNCIREVQQGKFECVNEVLSVLLNKEGKKDCWQGKRTPIIVSCSS